MSESLCRPVSHYPAGWARCTRPEPPAKGEGREQGAPEAHPGVIHPAVRKKKVTPAQKLTAFVSCHGIGFFDSMVDDVITTNRTLCKECVVVILAVSLAALHSCFPRLSFAQPEALFWGINQHMLFM